MRKRRSWYQRLLSWIHAIARLRRMPGAGEPAGAESLRFFKMLQLYPPFLFLGVRIDSLSADGTELTTSLPLRWYATNFHGTHFGGSLCAWSDPFPALLCARLIPDVEVWTKDHRVEFRRPARGRLTLRVKVGETDLEEIKRQLDTAGKATRTFECPITDASGTVVARVTNTAYVRRRPKRSEPVGDRG